jgi:3-oxosteroid 1-dehydrogenase
MTEEKSTDSPVSDKKYMQEDRMAEDKEEPKVLSRREFVKGAALGAGAFAGAGALASCSTGATAEPTEAPEAAATAAPAQECPVCETPWLPDTWDYEADVVVVGYGGAGAVTAIAAADAGAEVLILEKNPQNQLWCNTRMCGGLCHVADDASEAAKYFKAVAFGLGLPDGFGDPAHVYPHYPEQFVEDIAQAWAEGVVQTGDFLQSLGEVEFTNGLEIPKAAFSTFPGAEHYGTFSVAGRGIALYELLANAVNERNVEMMWGSPAKRLITDPEGEVIGVVAQEAGAEISVKARKAVVLCSGGFEYDEELKDAFIPGWGWVFMGNPSNTGDGLRMAMGVGATLGHMYHNAARVVAGGPALMEEIGTGIRIAIEKPGMLLVDNYGERYINEVFTSVDPQRYQFYNQVIVYDISKLEYPRIPSWFIFDETVRQAGPLPSTFYGAIATGIYDWSEDNSAEVEKGWILRADTLEELAAVIAADPNNRGRMDATTLANTVAVFNQYSEGGEDLDFARDPETLGALTTPPYYAIDMYPGGPNTEGGMIRDAKSQVISVRGDVIPRLYAVGEVGSFFSFAYQGGGNIAGCIIFGRVAGENAAAEEPWE